MSEMNDVLERFHRTLVEEIRARKPEYLEEPFSVAEIYQTLVPYGTHRDRIGVEMNGDYEDALLRLLAGQDNYLILDSEAALRQLREEMSAPNPNTGLYREFAAVDVRLNPERMPPGDAPPSTTEAYGQGRVEVTLEAGPIGAPSGSAVEDSADEEAAEAAAPETCRWCRAPLPARERLNFCPFCGTDVNVVPCPECGEELEPDWRFCIACGTEVQG